MVEEWITLPQLARELGVSDSTARRWAAAFPELLPSKGKGASRRFHPQARQVLSKLRTLLEGGLNTEQAAAILHTEYSATLNAVTVSEAQAEGERSNLAPADLVELLSQALQVAREETAAALEAQEKQYISALQEHEQRHIEALQKVQAEAEKRDAELRAWLSERLPEPQAKRLGLVARVRRMLAGDRQE